jgi:sugar-specific transcriptional regulator TrmB
LRYNNNNNNNNMDYERIINAFEAVGIPKMQTLVYLDLLKNKESNATDVSKRTKMHRANVYDTLTKLKERNLVYLSTKDGTQVFAALPTDLIVSGEKDRLENLKLAMDYIKTIKNPIAAELRGKPQEVIKNPIAAELRGMQLKFTYD